MATQNFFLAAAAAVLPVAFAQWGSGRPNPSNYHGSAGSPTYNYMYQVPLPIPPVATPIQSQEINGVTVDFYESEIKAFQKQIYPNLGPANFVGYNGTAPGPTYWVERGHETVIRYLNSGHSASVVHLHGSYTHAAWDGWASDLVQPGQYKDYYYPNTEAARSIWYHDHANGQTAADAYYGQGGTYIIYDPAEDALGLPSGSHDVILGLTDKIFQSNGDLASPTGSPIGFYGDTILVNEQPWPYLSVEPRKYRFRIFDMALSRAFDLYLADASGNQIPFQVIASDSGLFGSPVDTSDVTISPGERYEIVVDFAQFSGQNVTMMNKLNNPQVQEYANTDKVMLFQVGGSVTDDSNNGDVPGTLNPAIQWPAKRDVVDHVFNFQMGGDNAMWTINGVAFDDVNNRVLARPPQGTVELWELRHTGGPAIHPVHVHLVNLQVISRSGGTRGVLPYETAGLKDVVLLEPGEIVRVLAFYGPWNGVYMFHCHNLVHEDNMMMAVFNTTKLSTLGYDFDSTQQFSDPMDTRFSPRPFADADYESAAIASTVSSFAALNAYAPASSLMSAENAYYATAGYNGDGIYTTQTVTAIPSSSGYGFLSTTLQPMPSVYRPTGRPGGSRGGPPHRREEASELLDEELAPVVTAAPSLARAFRG